MEGVRINVSIRRGIINVHSKHKGEVLFSYYTKEDIQSLNMFSVVTTLPYSTLIFDSLTILMSVRHKCAATFPTATFRIISFFAHILTNTKFKYVTSTYYHS
jgi:hypothetical protein